MLFKVVLFAYSQGIVSSRGIERACREHVTFMACAATARPHFTTIANFVSTLGEDIAQVFAAVLAICDRQGLIGREMFAIDGVKLPSNASKSSSGTRAEFERQAAKLEAAAQTMLSGTGKRMRSRSNPTWLTKEAQAHRAAATRRGADRASGCRSIPRTGAGRRARSARATARTTRAPRWRPAKA